MRFSPAVGRFVFGRLCSTIDTRVTVGRHFATFPLDVPFFVGVVSISAAAAADTASAALPTRAARP